MKISYILIILIILLKNIYCDTFQNIFFLDITNYYNNKNFLYFNNEIVIKNNYHILKIKKGVLFYDKNNKSNFNHQYEYLSLTPYLYFTKDIFFWVDFTNIDPYLENDLGITSNISSQVFGLQYNNFSIERKKIVNGDFYSNISYKNSFNDLNYEFNLEYKGLRGKATLLNIFNESINNYLFSISKEFYIKINNNINFFVIIKPNICYYSYLKYFKLGYNINIGLKTDAN